MLWSGCLAAAGECCIPPSSRVLESDAKARAMFRNTDCSGERHRIRRSCHERRRDGRAEVVEQLSGWLARSDSMTGWPARRLAESLLLKFVYCHPHALHLQHTHTTTPNLQSRDPPRSPSSPRRIAATCRPSFRALHLYLLRLSRLSVAAHHHQLATTSATDRFANTSAASRARSSR